ncbi:DUF4286 family protein [Chitinophaga oryziterrae]|uniref:DUF4286 family protein n=1 Tax=Chitinophaga oryziterrae TaxID=1031224 RepID=A0A6N8JG85_9BACT|nr:DUF4286 family protein [Chitinophaga oryziterrae]MVT44227.1 DUF4286 family protein [Chitinophaga oryziterrae]
MIIYNVTTKVTNNINEEWLRWMKQEHIPMIMATGLFHDFRICRLLEQDDQDGPTYSIQYFTDTLENYQTYLSEHAPALNQTSYLLFGSQFVSFRTVMQVV